MFWVQVVLIGLAFGAALSLAGLGLVFTYKATGVFNFAHGAIGVFVAYTLFQMHHEWNVPTAVAAPIAILVVGPGIGLLLERFVFRPLQRAGATTTEKLVATLGVFVLFTGIVFSIWKGTVRPATHLVSTKGFDIVPGQLRLGYINLVQMATLAAVAVLLWALFRFTHLGTEIRAVVDRPDLAGLASIDANRVAGLAWALGAGLAGLAGVLLSQVNLEPLTLNLLLLETVSIPVMARLTSLPRAVGAGVVLLGVGSTLLQAPQVQLFGGRGVIGQMLTALKPNVSVVLLFLALLVYQRLDVVGEAAERVQRLAASARRAGARRSATLTVVVGLALVLLPAVLSADGRDRALGFLAFVVIFASIVAVTGLSGQITLGQAGYAGLGAWAAARIGNAAHLPVIVAMVLGALVAMGAGLLTGWPALRRRGLFLALVTLAFGLLIYRFVLDNKDFASGAGALQVVRPSLFGLSLGGPLAFYYFELAWVGLMLLLVRNLRSGRLGRALGAMRDSEAGARSVGIDLRAYKLFIFAASAFIAGIGGALLTQKAEVFTAEQFFPLNSLFWFAAVVVAGVNSIVGAVLGAFLWVMLDVVLRVQGLSQLVIGAGALALGRLPGGNLVGMVRVGSERVTASLRAAFARARREALAAGEPVPDYEPSEVARRLLSPRATRTPAPSGAGPSRRSAR